ncbi:MAG: APC family permease [Gemmatimonadota bacterium]|jgi:amino acid transporter
MSDDNGSKGMGFWSVTSIGVGGMVGGGIFAVLGLSVQLAKGGAPVAFAVAGVVALVTAYSYTRLSVSSPSKGGTVSFLDRAFGPGMLTGSANILLWISYIVMLALYAYAFGSYGAELIPGGGTSFWRHVLISGVLVLITGLNLLSAKLVGEAEDFIVGIKVAILLLFIAVGLWGVDTSAVSPSAWAPPLQLVAGGMIIFLAYEGFELIANAAEDVADPERTLPRAFYTSVGFVLVLYVLVALVTVGTLPLEKIAEARDYALAAAARPFLGDAGRILVAVAAVLSTASAINATLYGAARLSYIIAKDGELPKVLERNIWNRPLEGLLITAVAALLLANLVDLSSMSTMGSAGFLLIFAGVNAANAKLASETGSRRWISLAGAVLCLLALLVLLGQTWRTSPARLGILGGMAALALAVEGAYRLFGSRSR